MNNKTIAAILIAVLLAYGGYEWHERTDDTMYPGAPGDTWCNTSFAKRIDVNVNNTAGSALTDYQVYVNLSLNPINETSLRVYNSTSCTLRSHWTENETGGNSYGVWINYSSIAASVWTNNTAIYYDNVGASSASNGTNTFEFFDDFEDTETKSKFENFEKYASNPLTSIPHYSANGEVHPDVLYFPSGIYGYKYWMVYTPYPPNSAEWASIVRSNDGITWTDTGITNPVIKHAGWEHGSDPDMIYVSSLSKWFIAWASNTGSAHYHICLAYSSDGKTWTEYDGATINGNTNPIILSGEDTGKQAWEYTTGPISKISYPTLIYEGGTFYLFYGGHKEGNNRGKGGYATFTWNNTADDVENFLRYASNPVIDLAQDSDFKSGGGHYALSEYNNTYYMYVTREILSAVEYEIGLLTSTDKINWANQGKVLARGASGEWDDKRTYRGSPVTDGIGTIILFSDKVKLYYSGYNVSTSYPQIGFANGSEGAIGGLDTDKWNETNSPIINISDSILELKGGVADQRNIISKSKHLSINESLRFRTNFGTKDFIKKIGGKTVTGAGTDAWYVTQILQYSGWPNTKGGSGDAGGGNHEYLDFGTDYSAAYHNFEIYRYTTGVKFYVDGNLKNTSSTHYHSQDEYVFYEHYNSDLPSYTDWILVRKYASSEPSSNLGSEEQQPGGTTPVISNVQNGSVSSTSQYVDWDVNQTAHNRVVYDKGSVGAGSTACEGQWSTTHACANASDGDWSSYAESAGAMLAYAYFNYTVPTGVIQSESLWHVKDAVGHANLTIPSACWGGTLYLRAMCSDIGNSITWQCDNGPGWTTLQSSVANIAYEQEMKFKYTSSWDNSTSAPNITLSSLTPNTKYYYQAWSYNTTNTSLSDNSNTMNFTTASGADIIVKQWIDVSSYNNTHVIYNLTTWTHNNYTSSLNASVDVDANWTDYNINNLAPSASDTHTQSATFVRPLSDANFTAASAILGNEAAGTSNNIKVFLPVDPPSKAAGYNDITILAGNRALFCNWSEDQTFQQIQANLTNTTDYFWYNSTSQKWVFYNVNRSINQDTLINKHNAVMVCFNKTTTVSCNMLSPETITMPSNIYYYSALRESTSKTLTEISTDITADGCTITDLYAWNSTAGAYTNTGSYSVLPNEGFAIYCSVGCDWDGGI